MTPKMTTIALAAMLAAGLRPSLAEAGEGWHGGPHQGPPQVVLDACASFAEGDACSFTGRNDETLNGTCVESPFGLTCLPEGFRGPHGGPDAEWHPSAVGCDVEGLAHA